MDTDSSNFFTLSISLNLFKYARVNLSSSWITLNSWCWSVSLAWHKGHWTLQWRLAPNYCTMHVQAPRRLYEGLYTLSHCYKWPTLSCYTYFTHAPLGWPNHHSYPNLFFYIKMYSLKSQVFNTHLDNWEPLTWWGMWTFSWVCSSTNCLLFHCLFGSWEPREFGME